MKLSAKNRIAIGRKTDTCQCASVLVMGKLIPIGSVINLEKKTTPTKPCTLTSLMIVKV